METVPDFGPLLFEAVQVRLRWRICEQALITYFDQWWEFVCEEAISPDAFGVEDVAEGFEDASMRGAEVAA